MVDGGGSAYAASPKAPARWKIALTAQREERLMLVLSILIGALTGGAVVAFILLTERLGMRLYPVGSAAWHRIFIPVMGSIAMGFLLYRYFPDARGSGVPQTKAALYAREGVITGGTIFGKFFCTAATLASGIPLGREGPSVQVGAGIASVLGRRLGLQARRIQALLPAGAAAAIAAAFNTPLAGVVFSLEEIIGDLNAPVLGSVVLASATSWLVLRMLLGNDPLFQVPQYQLVHPLEFPIYGVLGIVGGLVSVVFTKLLLGLRARFLAFPKRTRWFQPVAGALVVGLMGWWVPQVLGVGYGYVGDALNGRMALRLMALLILLKLVTVTVSYGSGNAGGIFGPSLFIGAMVGGTLGSIAHHLWPAYTALPGAYALVGMGTLFAGILRAPMTSVLMIFETTHDYAVIVPLMISNLASFFISSRLQRQPIYEVLSEQDGVHLPSEAVRQRRGQRPVAEIMRAPNEIVSADSIVREVFDAKKASEPHAWPVGNGERVIGVVSLADLQLAIATGGEGKRVRDLICGDDFPHVHSDHPLDLALERMGTAKLDAIPVVSRADFHIILGIVVLSDLLEAFGIDRQGSEE
ncbi:MAG TPA: chloride channel protein [Candidatus Acidoferrales bacterium]|nr:chloride channel protein [Candidatus Acidoferrales bacterium]